jgi:dolichyl-diphosphooligosaccharide--protein glycosyltransferase
LRFPLGNIRSLARRPTVSRRHVMLFLVLVSIFCVAIVMRSFPAKYGFYLNEFDPYYDYKAANYIVTSFDQSWHAGTGGFAGVMNYFSYVDHTTWFPEGRNVAPSSQDGLQFAGAFLFIFFRNVFGIQYSLYDFLVLLPVFLEAFAALLTYLVVKKIAGDAAGLFAGLMMAVSPPLIQRGNLGWFKSEPLALLLFAATSYLFLTLFDSHLSSRQRVFRAILAGLILGYANTSWGGALYFSAAFGIMLVVLPFLEVDLSQLSVISLLFTASVIFGSAIFPRPGPAVVTSPTGIALIGGTIVVLIARWLKSWVKPADYRKTLVMTIFGFGVAALSIISFGLVSSLSLRYLSAIFPWVRSSSALFQSVAEQFVPTGSDYFTAYIVLLFFSIFGVIAAFKKKNVGLVYMLVFGITGLYVSAAFSRLLVYSSVALSVLGGIGFSELLFALVKIGRAHV